VDEDARLAQAVRNWTIALGLLALGAVMLALFVYSKHPEPGSALFELLKTLYSVVAVAIVGGFAALAYGTIQRGRQALSESAQKARDKDAEEKKRDLEERIDQKRRLDKEVSRVLSETLKHWLEVKRIRRELKAVMAHGTEGHASISLQEYDRYFRKLNEHQLAFERLKKLAPFLENRLQAVPAVGEPVSLVTSYTEIEEYLNDLVDEYEKCRHLVVPQGEIAVSELTQYSNSHHRYRSADGTQRKTLSEFVAKADFRDATERGVDRVVNRLRDVLLQPLDLTSSRSVAVGAAKAR
jgi:hypothetical protein